jgi:hypothetical protein
MNYSTLNLYAINMSKKYKSELSLSVRLSVCLSVCDRMIKQPCHNMANKFRFLVTVSCLNCLAI